MAESEPTLDLWHRLYDLAARIWTLKPWAWMQENQLFAVRDPEAPEHLGFVSIMGAAGEFPAVTVYLGRQALWDFRKLMLHPEKLSLEEGERRLLLIPQLMLFFERPRDLAPEDRAVMGRLGLDWTEELYPLFRSYRPAYFPWYLEADEARFLALALEQVLAVAPLVQRGEVALRPEDHPKYYIRTLVEDEAEARWEGHWEEVEPPPLRRVRFSLPEDEIDHANALPQEEDTLEVHMDLVLEMGPLQDAPQQRPYFPYFFLSVQIADRPQVVDAHLMRPAESAQLAESFARLLLASFHKMGHRPREVRMDTRAHYVQVAQWLSGLLDFRVRVEPLQALPGAWAYLVEKSSGEGQA